MGKTLKVSEARKRLFDLVEEVTSESEEIVWIEHRDRPARAALVSEDHLRRLHATIEALRRRRPSAFRVAGSLEIVDGPDSLEEALSRSRAEQGELAATKFQDL
jgi:PHD/YefM family antitoxin component YafN of YafNO toxin-antitoxin module